MQGEQTLDFPVVIMLLHCVCYINLHCIAKYLLFNCMVYGHIRGFTILLECVYMNSSQPQWEMRWILMYSGIREAWWISHIHTGHSRHERHQNERKKQSNFSTFVLQPNCCPFIQRILCQNPKPKQILWGTEMDWSLCRAGKITFLEVG